MKTAYKKSKYYPNFTTLVNNSNGFSLIEIMIVAGIMGIIVLAMTTMQNNQLKANNYLEFQLKRTQLHGALLGQILKNSNNCACLFSGATAFPIAGIATLEGVTPTQIGSYSSAAPACGAPTQELINTTGVDGIKATSIKLQSITPTADPNTYTGSFNVNIQSIKDVLGPVSLPISIPVNIVTTPSGANVNFVSCTTSAIAAATPTEMGVAGTEGWVRRPDGLLEQWGYATGFSGNQSAITINFSKPFVDTNYSITLTTVIPGVGDYDNYVQELNGTRTTNSVNVYSQDPSSGGLSAVSGVRWHALGL